MIRAIERCSILPVLWILLSGAAMAGTPQVVLPSWVQEITAQPRKNYEPRTNAVVLLDEHTISTVASGEYVETVRRVVRILRPEGKSEGTVAIYRRDADTLLSAHAWCSSPDGHNYEVRQKEFEQAGAATSGILYMDLHIHRAEVPGSNPGALVAFEYSLRKRAWGDYFNWWIQEDIPVEEKRLHLEIPAGWNYKASWVNTSPTPPESSNTSNLTWIIKNLPAYDYEERHRPSLPALAARMQLAFSPASLASPVFSNWESIGRWNEELVQPRREPSPEIVARVQQLTATASGFDDTVARLADFMQREIRYVGIEIGLGGYQPHAAAQVFHNRYGDCKDKATLMASMLQVAGIRTRNVLIFAAHGVTREDSPGNFFNHEILAIELPPTSSMSYRSVVQSKSGVRYLIFDPTSEWVPLGDLPEQEQGNFALLSGKDGGELIRLPVAAPEVNQFTRTGKFVLAEDGSISGELEVSSSGSHAIPARRNVKRESELERTQNGEQFLARSLQGVTLKKLAFENLDQRTQEFKVQYSFSAPNFIKSNGPLLLFPPCVFGHKAISIDWKKRKNPVDLEAATQELDRYEIALPAGMEIDDLPDPVQIDVGFASYKSRVVSNQTSIRYEREYIVRDPQISVEKLAQLRKFEEAILRDESSSVVLKKKN